MSKQTVRTILAGTALIMTLTFTFPVSTEAAGWNPVADRGGVLELVLHWFSNLWNGGHVLAKTVASSSPGTGTTTSGTVVCGGDQGVCIDPNG